MKLDSVRGLKQEINQSVLKPLLKPASIRALGVAARASDLVTNTRTLAIGVAPRSGGGFDLAVRLQRRSLENSPEVAEIRRRAKGEVDVRVVGRIARLAAASTPWHQGRCRPLLIGCSVGHHAITAGTLGCFVVPAKAGKAGAALILSNNHVLANENAAKAGDAILQPGDFDGGKRPKDTVAKLERFVALKTAGANFVDAAIAQVGKGVAFDPDQMRGLGTLKGLSTQAIDTGLAVAKVGRTTGVTRGRVTAFELDNVVVAYDIGNLRFDDQIEIEGAGSGPFSLGGDSGSLIVDGEFGAFALLFAGGDQGGSNGQGLTYGNPIRPVLKALGVKLLT